MPCVPDDDGREDHQRQHGGGIRQRARQPAARRPVAQHEHQGCRDQQGDRVLGDQPESQRDAHSPPGARVAAEQRPLQKVQGRRPGGDQRGVRGHEQAGEKVRRQQLHQHERDQCARPAVQLPRRAVDEQRGEPRRTAARRCARRMPSCRTRRCRRGSATPPWAGGPDNRSPGAARSSSSRPPPETGRPRPCRPGAAAPQYTPEGDRDRPPLGRHRRRPRAVPARTVRAPLRTMSVEARIAARIATGAGRLSRPMSTASTPPRSSSAKQIHRRPAPSAVRHGAGGQRRRNASASSERRDRPGEDETEHVGKPVGRSRHAVRPGTRPASASGRSRPRLTGRGMFTE